MSTILLNVVLPIVITGLINALIWWLQSRKEEPKMRSEILMNLEDTMGGLIAQVKDLSEQLAVIRKEIKILRDGARKLVKQIISLGATPVWEPNGHGLFIHVEEDVDGVGESEAKKKAK